MGITKIINVRRLRPGATEPDATSQLFLADDTILAWDTVPESHASKSIERTFDAQNAIITPGWIDIGAHAGSPGREHREDYAHLNRAALLGGFAQVAVLPDNLPVADNQTGIAFVLQHNQFETQFLPLGAVTKQCAGQEMAELYDMQQAGAVGFIDGKRSIASAALLLRSLEYAKPGGLRILHHAFDESLSAHGQMHEGVVSTSLGLPGIPAMAEEIMVQRDIALVRYSMAPLHICGISTEGSAQLIRAAKAEGLPITASAYVMNAIFDESELLTFNTNFKVLPPLRTAQDVKAIRTALADGTLDCLQSGHYPLDIEAKDLEFPYAKPGAIGLETALPLSFKYLVPELGLARVVALWTSGPAKVLSLTTNELAANDKAQFTLIDDRANWQFALKDIGSRSKNTPLLGHHFNARALNWR